MVTVGGHVVQIFELQWLVGHHLGMSELHLDQTEAQKPGKCSLMVIDNEAVEGWLVQVRIGKIRQGNQG